MLACHEDHPSLRNSLMLLPDSHCVGVGLGRACTVPGLPGCAVHVSCKNYLKYVICEFDQMSGQHMLRYVDADRSFSANPHLGRSVSHTKY